MRRSERTPLHGTLWRDLASVVVDLARYLFWCMLAGLIGGGSYWCAGHLSYPDWLSANPPPRFRLVTEIRLRRQVAHGLDEMMTYLEEEAPRSIRKRRPS